MRICAYPRCRHRENVDNCGMHRLPSSPRATVQWMKSCHWMGSPKKIPFATYLCSCHFNGGQGPTKENRIPDACEDDVAWVAVIEGRRGSLRGKNMGPRIRSKKKKESSLASIPTPVTPQGTSLITQMRNETAFTPIASVTPEHIGKIRDANVSNTAVAEPLDVATGISSFEHDHHSTAGGTAGGVFNSSLLEGENIRAESPPVKSTQLYSTEIFANSTYSDTSETGDSKILLRPYLDLAAPLRNEERKTNLSEQADIKSNFCIRRPKRKYRYDEYGGEKGGGTGGGSGTQKGNISLQADLPIFSYERCRHWTEADFKHLTGINQSSFVILYTLLGGDVVCTHLKYRYDQITPHRATHPIHSPKGHLFLTLVRLRRGFTVITMRMLFGLDESSVSRVFTAWIKLMSIKFKSIEDALFTSVSAQSANTPDCYKPFPNLRCVVDAFEIYIQKPENMEQQSNTFSTYKGRNTVKFLLGSSVYGGVSFLSNGIEGSASDRKLFLKSGILRHLNSGEAVMSDRGFDVEPELNRMGVELIIPPYLGNRDAFTLRELMLQRSIASARSHVETVIGRVENFNLIGETFPNTMLDILPDVVRVAANLVNFSDPFIRWDQKKKKWVDVEKEAEKKGTVAATLNLNYCGRNS